MCPGDARLAVERVEPEVRAEQHPAVVLYPLTTARVDDPGDCGGEVVVPDVPGGDAADLVERGDVALEERLLALGGVDPVHRLPGVTQPECEEEDLRLHPGHDDVELAEVDFCFCAWRVLLGDHDFDPAASFEADLRAADADVVANRRVRHLNGVVFLDEADVDPAGGVPLLSRRLKVGAEHVVDGRLERIQPGRGTHRGLPRRWFRGREGPANGAASDLVLACERSDRHALDPGVPTDRSEQFHTHPHPETHFRCREDRWMRVLLTPRKWVQIKPSRRHAEARVGPESDRHTGPESDCHRHTCTA